MNTAAFAVVFALAVGASQAFFVIERGDCPVVNTPSTFDTARYLGGWYEYARFPAIFEVGLDCVKATYGDNGDGSISVTNQGFRRASILGRQIWNRESVANGRATVPDAAKPAELSVTFSAAQPQSPTANYFIVDTDYDNYSIVFSCSDALGANLQFAWILVRNRGTPSNLADLMATLSGYGINVDNFRVTDQEGCSN